jgi:hypothetical protein
MSSPEKIRINRAPVLTLWAAVVAERLGFDRKEAMTFGRAVAGMSAAIKGKALGIFEPGDPREIEAERRKPVPEGEELHVRILGRPVPAIRTKDGIRALDKGKPGVPASVESYLRSKFGDGYTAARRAMEELAAAYDPRDLAFYGFKLYEAFRPEVPAGAKGWGAAGELDLGKIEAMVRERQGR